MPLTWHEITMKIYILINIPFKKGLGGFEFFPPTPSLRGASYATWQSHLSKFFMLLIYRLRITIKKTKGTLPAVKRHPSTEGNCSIHSPIEGGFKGGVPFNFLLNSFFIYSGIYRIKNSIKKVRKELTKLIKEIKMRGTIYLRYFL